VKILIYCSEQFRKQYSRLGSNYREKIHDIVNEFNAKPYEKQKDFLVSLCGKNGKAKWIGINKTLYHLYPQGSGSLHRLFYCYATDLDDKIRERCQISAGLILIDYTIRKEDEDKAAYKYENDDIKYFQLFEPPIKLSHQLIVENNYPTFWFCLTKDQSEVLNLSQPSLIKGSAGSGKTLISIELFKSWITEGFNRILYLTYTDNLLEKAKDTLTMDGINLKNSEKKYHCLKFLQIMNVDKENDIINENESRKIVSDIIDSYRLSGALPEEIIFSDYFVYSFIRGIIKGRFKEISEYKLDITGIEKHLHNKFLKSDFSVQIKDKLSRRIIDILKESDLDSSFYNDIITYLLSLSISKNEKKIIKEKLDFFLEEDKKSDFSKLNFFRKKTLKYDFINREAIIKILKKDGIKEKYCNLLLDISARYNEILKANHKYDDNDIAKFLLNKEILQADQYDGIIIDEIQDLTEIQVQAIVNLCCSNNISFFGDPNQTINPTVYDYGRFNSYVYIKTKEIHRRNLKTTYRCGPNLLEYINHLSELRKEFKITTEKEDLEKESSAIEKIDTYWACLIEDDKMINTVFEKFLIAEDCFLIVDNENTRNELINKINNLVDDADDEYLSTQIITVQNAKGLESKNVIIYNLISENLSIFENLMTENNKVSLMTFNKLYVSCTRAADSLLICEKQLHKSPNVKQKLFYFNGKSMVENIDEDEIELYMSISINPEVFYEQALRAIEDKNYYKAQKKNNIAVKNILNQFNEDDMFYPIFNYIKSNNYYNPLLVPPKAKNIKEIDDYSKIYLELIKDVKENFNDAVISILETRFSLLKKTKKLKTICEKRLEFEEYVHIMSNHEIDTYLNEFILLQDYDCSFFAANNLKNNSVIFEKFVKYFFGYEDFISSYIIFKEIRLSNPEVANYTLEHKVLNDSYLLLNNYLKKMEDFTYGN